MDLRAERKHRKKLDRMGWRRAEMTLHHSDCEGEIGPRQCAEIAVRLKEVLPLLPTGKGSGHIGNWKDKTSKFIEGCEAAAEAKEDLEFH